MNTTIIVLFLVTAMMILLAKRRLDRALARRDAMIARLRQDVAALTAAGAGVSGHLTRIERHLAEFAERQNQFETSTRVEHSYHQAIRLVSEGADIEQLIEGCGLVRDEAQLLRAFYQQRKAS